MKYILIVLSAMLIFTACVSEKPENEAETERIEQSENKEGDNQMSELNQTVAASISWAAEQALPVFASPADTLYTVHTSALKPDERVTVSALQGVINKSKPRILLTEDGDVPADKWATTFNLKTVKLDPYIMIEKYKDEVKGIVIYDASKSGHYRNAAATIANINGYLPVTNGVKNVLARQGVEFENIIDITGWTEASPLEIYGRLYDEYWQYCSKRLLVSANPADTGDLDHCRDIAAAVGAAVVWLDCTKAGERALYQKFMQDMADNREKNGETAIVLGWFTTERSGVIAGSVYGISTVPADIYISGSVYSGVTYNADPEDRTINIPAVPPKKDLENKVYISVFFTDGDNIQYVQRFMRKLWDSGEETRSRGKVPVNWTIAPGLVDIGPGILNYFYSLASDYECFVAGPSGMGYLMPTNTLTEPGAKTGDFLVERKYMDEYTKLTGRYMRAAGLRALTIWDDANADLRESYERNVKYLYGATVQNFRDREVKAGVINNRLFFSRLETHYEGVYNTVLSDMTRKIRSWANRGGSEPHFLTYQVKVWEFQTSQLVRLHDEIKQRFEGAVEIEFVRADHFFALYNEANGLPFNLCMNEKTAKIIASGGIYTNLNFDFGDIYNITRVAERESALDFTLELSEDGSNWVKAGEFKINAEKYVDADLDKAIKARYAKLIYNIPAGSQVSVQDIEIYGAVIN